MRRTSKPLSDDESEESSRRLCFANTGFGKSIGTFRKVAKVSGGRVRVFAQRHSTTSLRL